MRKTANSFWALSLTLFVLLVGSAAMAADTDIMVTEIMNNPAVLGDSVGEWFEVYNSGPDPVDMNGWTVSDNGTNTFTINASTIVPAGGYAVIGIDAAIMLLEGVTLAFDYDGTALANGDDEIILTNAGLVEIDRVEYDGGPVWPDLTGASMMWIGGDNNVGTNWVASTVPFGSGDLGTPGAANGDTPLQYPVVNNVYHRSLMPAPGENIVFYADATDADGTVTNVNLFYWINTGTVNTVPMTLDAGNTYNYTLLGGAADGDSVHYFVEAIDDDLQSAYQPETENYSVAVMTPVITPIATIHADSAGYDGTLVRVQGQVYIPNNYKGALSTPSGYIQDGSGRGLNVYGDFLSTGVDLLTDTSAIVTVTGVVDYYFQTLEVVRYEVTTVSTGNPALTPVTLGTGAAAAPSNEGTYIKSGGAITEAALVGGAWNFSVNDGSGLLIIRIDEEVVAGMDTWLVGDQIDAAGAGSTYSGQGQILVGLASDVVNSGQGPDVTAPTLDAAVLGAATEVTLTFNEAIDPVTGNNAANYQVFETATPANTITVSTAAVQIDAKQVVLTLAASASGIDHTVQVDNVEDVAGNPIAAATTLAIYEAGAPADIVITEIMQNPDVLFDSDGEWFEIYNGGTSAVDLNGWTISDLGTDSHVIASSVIVAPGAYAVLGVNATAMAGEGVTLAYQYSGVTLGNSVDELVLTDTEARMVDTVIWDDGVTFPDPVGYSMQWNETGDNDDGANWTAYGAPVFGNGDRGTPGAANDNVSPAPMVMITGLEGNFPNPFNPTTAFNFTLQKDDQVRLTVFDVRGRQVRRVVDGQLTAGQYLGTFTWDGKDDAGRSVTSGVYFYSLETGSGYKASQKMTLLK